MSDFAPREVEDLIAGLAAALRVQERLIDLIEARTSALRRADADAMAAADRDEAAALAEGVALERKRRTQTATLAAALGLSEDAGLAAIAEGLAPVPRRRLLDARAALRDAAEANGRRAASAARAAAAAAAHVDGLVRRMKQRSSGARYAASGRHAPARLSLSRMSLVA
ncbi:flagellar export chaperone FlgN [Phycisphaera mikurensis]|uniref:Flagellar protein FlgN n=1 Tax=Phycisphaera mikurensis (strain NBRC 102666 / KCTC 22515 / FYK2301M01) TaxID=1142394 RepID=I0IAM8_PHYMF|nr:flagellar export chaperone FlgN [Phycisphaera mikurensis]MBB6441688.1 hypothetical protein [Phycisphaera mikurensis]BAM02316.1 hypothetical protein PSMK_01570 [Phycisphaera mikurensis NBRC 102666]